MSTTVSPSVVALLDDPGRLAVLAACDLVGGGPEPGFDDLALLASQICNAPVAFVSFLDGRRQWLKARIGLPMCETPLDQAICAHTLAQRGLLLIPDLMRDPRTATLQCVLADPFLRFYAGVRIDGAGGQPLGTLCVMDVEPRSEGLTAPQASALAALARQVEAQIALRQATTERDRLSRQALHEKSLEFEALAENVSQLAWMTNADGNTYWFNRRWLAYTGFDLEAMRGWGWTRVLRTDQGAPILARVRARRAAAMAYEDIYELRAADGSFRPFLMRLEPIRDATGQVLRWFGTGTDISAQVEAERRLTELNATLQQRIEAAIEERAGVEDQLRQAHKMEAVGQLTGGLAHDFNNILGSISGNLELLELRLAQGRPEELQRYLDVARGATRRAATLTHRLLAFSRRQTLDPRPTDLNALVADMEELVRRTMGPTIEVELVREATLWTTLVDAAQLDNALLNLCLNARDAMPEGGHLDIKTAGIVLDPARAGRLGLPPGDYVSLLVTDTGRGMTPEVLARAFDPFFTTKPLGEGTGLGLSMVHGFAGQSHGQVHITSAPGQGTRVELLLPRHLGEAPAAREAAAPYAPSRTNAGQVVLVVEDEAEMRSLMVEVLSELGCSVREADNGASALQVLRSGSRIDLLITDIGLPGGMNGRQVAEVAVQEHPGLGVLFVTGYDQTAVMGQQALGPDTQVLTKPFTMTALVRCTQELIGRKERRTVEA